MTGLKSGSGDDLWGDDGDDSDNDEAETSDAETTDTGGTETNNGRTDDQSPTTPDRTDASSSDESGDDEGPEATEQAATDPSSGTEDKGSTEQSATTADDAASALDASSVDVGTTSTAQPYIVRRAVQDKSSTTTSPTANVTSSLTWRPRSAGTSRSSTCARRCTAPRSGTPRPCSKNSWRWATRSTRSRGRRSRTTPLQSESS
jgi:hypothetical protein